MSTRFILTIAAFLGLGLLCWMQKGRIEGLERRLADQDRYIGEVTAANISLSTALREMERENRAAGALLLDHAQRNETLTASARRLENRLREGLDHASTDIEARLPDDVAVALCLRWQAAHGRGQGDPAPSAAQPAHGEADSAAAGCTGWRGLTVRQSLEWLGLMLDHAGRERLDKASLREWSEALSRLTTDREESP